MNKLHFPKLHYNIIPCPRNKTVVAYSVFHHDQKHWLWTWTWLCWAKYQRALQRGTFSEPPLLTSTFNYPLTSLYRVTVYLWMSISPTTHMLHCGYAISSRYYLSPKRSLVLCSLHVVVSKEKGSSRYDSSRLFGSTTPVPPQHHHHHLATCLLLNAATNRWCSIRLHSNLGGTVATLVPVVFVVKRHVMSRQSKNFSISSRWPRFMATNRLRKCLLQHCTTGLLSEQLVYWFIAMSYSVSAYHGRRWGRGWLTRSKRKLNTFFTFISKVTLDIGNKVNLGAFLLVRNITESYRNI